MERGGEGGRGGQMEGGRRAREREGESTCMFYVQRLKAKRSLLE